MTQYTFLDNAKGIDDRKVKCPLPTSSNQCQDQSKRPINAKTTPEKKAQTKQSHPKEEHGGDTTSTRKPQTAPITTSPTSKAKLLAPQHLGGGRGPWSGRGPGKYVPSGHKGPSRHPTSGLPG